MEFFLPFLFGFIASTIGILPPGLLNMTASKIGIQEGKNRAVLFAIGATIIVLLQTFIAVKFAEIIDKSPEILMLIRKVGLFIFTILTIYFFSTSKKFKPKNQAFKIKSKKSRFFMGMLLSALNFFPIPYYVFVSVSLGANGLFRFEQLCVNAFVLGTGLGAFAMFYAYIEMFKKMEHKATFILNNMNYIIGTITGLVSINTLVNILKSYF